MTTKTFTAAEAGSLGGRKACANQTAERRREIARNAGIEASRKRAGLPTVREVTATFFSIMEAYDPDLAKLLQLISKAPARYQEAFPQILTERERELTKSVWAAALKAYGVSD